MAFEEGATLCHHGLFLCRCAFVIDVFASCRVHRRRYIAAQQFIYIIAIIHHRQSLRP
jgi:hypothetical protein